MKDRRCLICGNQILLDNISLVIKGYTQCPKCFCFAKENSLTAIELKNKLSNMMLRACFDKSKESERMKKAEYQLDTIERFIEIGSLYDVGAAAGFFIKAARTRGWKVHGNEISKSAIEWASKNYSVDIDYGFLEEISITDNSFDAVILWNTLEHVFNPIETMMMCNKILKKNGIIQIEVPLKNKEDMEKYMEPLHLFEFNRSGLDILLNNNGFVLVDNNEFIEKNRKYIDVIYRKTNDLPY